MPVRAANYWLITTNFCSFTLMVLRGDIERERERVSEGETGGKGKKGNHSFMNINASLFTCTFREL